MSKAQDSSLDSSHQFTVIHLPAYYNEKGVVFNKDYVVGIEMRNLQSRYTPTKDDIIKAEKIFNNKYNEIRKTNVDTKTFFCRWVRQYVGLIDNNGNKNIIVQLVDNTKPRIINRLFGKGWETSFVIYFADPYPGLGIPFRINIDTGEMSDQL
ncbi:hypothetical protein COR50_21780 [Chitinophaga caeni]|uniref:Uncharacterized protein n=2 Tax=Chitinophaga caeni TaxID=2029983 RepID=A0A291R0G6_9BACT|nr:hypothetical protein COR50_21780 [Chitinophaga caeni]